MAGELPYSIETWPTQNLVKVTVTGFWDTESIERFSQEVESAILHVKRVTHRPVLLLSDGSKGPIQHRDSISEMQKLAARFKNDIKCMAFLVIGSALHTMQVRRVDPSDNRRVFDNEAAAMAWLMEGDGSVMAAPPPLRDRI